MSSTPAPQVFRLANGGTTIEVMDFGATWLSCVVTLADGSTREVVLAGSTPQEHLALKGYLGQTVGRYANRIADAKFSLEGKTYPLVPNEGVNQLHGGPDCFSVRRWTVVSQSPTEVVFGLDSPDGDQGFPGNLAARASYRVEADGSVTIEHGATVDQPCPVNFTNHTYFNLDGVPEHATRHSLLVRAAHYLPTRPDAIPIGDLAPVAGTSFDFRAAKPIERDLLTDLQQRQASGYDHAFLLEADCASGAHAAAELTSSDQRVSMRLYTSMPSVQFYSGQYLDRQPDVPGRFQNFGGVALEPQFLPDSPNHPEWPQASCILRPGETYSHSMRYVFVPH